jgi:hypothetical protein
MTLDELDIVLSILEKESKIAIVPRRRSGRLGQDQTIIQLKRGPIVRRFVLAGQQP